MHGRTYRTVTRDRGTTSTSNLSLPLLIPSRIQNTVYRNEALLLLDRLG